MAQILIILKCLTSEVLVGDDSIEYCLLITVILKNALEKLKCQRNIYQYEYAEKSLFIISCKCNRTQLSRAVSKFQPLSFLSGLHFMDSTAVLSLIDSFL